VSRVYLSKELILRIHQAQIERFGGSDGILNEGAVDSALGRLQSGYYEDVIEEAAALWESLAGNHPFQDGNKRTAFMATDLFLKANGKNITAKSEDTIAFIYERYERQEMNFNHLKAWLQDNTRDRDQSRQQSAADELLQRYPSSQRKQGSQDDDNGHDH